MTRTLHAFIALSLTLASSTVVAQAADCLSYEPAVVTVSGVVDTRTFPGPPNYENIAAGDRPETYWLLKLSNNVCVTGAKDDDLNTSEDDVTEMQLLLDDKQYNVYRRLVGKKVIVTGTLFHQHTGHHRTKVLLTVAKVVAG